MAILYINTGTSPNKGDGDSLRTAFNKINQNFSYLTSSTIISSATTGNFVFNANTMTVSSGALEIRTNQNVWNYSSTGTLTVPGNIIPNADNVYDLGTPDKQWRHVYTAGGSIYLDNIKLTNVNGKFTATKVINPGEENEQEDPEDSDATSELKAINELINGENTLTLEDDGTLTLNGSPFTGSGGLPTITVPGEQGTTYKGLQVSYGMIHSNGSSSEYNVNKIVIYKPSIAATTIDETTSNDTFEVSSINSDVLAMFVFYGDTNGAKPLSTLQAFAEAAIDNVILTGGVEGQYETIANMRSNFYNNYQILASAAGGLYANFQFYESGINFDPAAATTVQEGSGAVFDITGDGSSYAVTVTSVGTNYLPGHKILIPYTAFGASDGRYDVVVTITDTVTPAATAETANPGFYTVGSWTGVTGTNYNVGSGITISFIGLNPDLSIQYVQLGSAGANYVAGDALTLPGTAFVNGTSPANDITLTIVSVDGSGASQGYNTTGTVVPSWPANNISDGGADQYDNANYISTNLFNQIPYNSGIVTTGTTYFGTGSNYCTLYQNSIFGIIATGSSATSIRTSGNSGADGSSTAEAGNIYGPNTTSQTFTNAVTHINLIGDVFAGPMVSFTRPDNSDETIDVLIADDGEGSGVAIARNNNGNGIFNPYREEGWSNNTSPAGTLWNTDGWNDLSDLTTRIYDNLYAAFGSGGLGNKIVGAECVMYLPDNGKYYAVKFDSWTQGGNGGGFAYTRREIDLNNLQEGIRFIDGTRLKSAEGLGRVKLESPGARRIEEVHGYKAVTLTPIASTTLTTTSTRTVTNSNDIWIDSTATTIDEIIDNPGNYNNAYDFDFSLDDVTWYGWNGSTGFDGNERAYSIFPTQISYNAGDTIYFRYKTGGTPVVWWDKNELPGGAANFRGAIIDYHAWTGESTIIGTIHIVDDDGEDHITHQEVQSGSTDGENDDLWFVNTEGQIQYRRIDGEGKTLKVQWSARVFYGSEFYDD